MTFYFACFIIFALFVLLSVLIYFNFSLLRRKEKEAQQANTILEYVLSNIPFPIFVKNYSKGGQYVLINKHFYKFIGITNTLPVKDKTDYDIFEHHLAKKFQDIDYGIIERGVMEDSNITIYNEDGVEQTNRIIVCPMKSPYGEDLLMGIAIDITKLIDTQKQLESHIEREKIINSALSSAISSDVKKPVLENFLCDVGHYMKSDRVQIYVYDEKEKIAKLIDEWLKDDTAVYPDEFASIPFYKAPKSLKQMQEHNVLSTNEIPGVNCLGFDEISETCEALSVKSALTLGIFHKGSLWGILCFDYLNEHIFTKADYDTAMSVIKVQELYLNRCESVKVLQEAVNVAKAAEKSKDLFLSTMSHEIRTPLNAVIGYSELNQYDHLSENDRLENLKNINFAANSLLTLINDILDLSKLEAGFAEMNLQPMNMQEFLEDIVRIFKYRATLKDVELVLNVDSQTPVVKLDSLRLKQVLMNLLGNAVKFTDSGIVSVNCSLTPTSGNKVQLVISVKDTGMGISEDYIKTIFNPFERQSINIATGKQAHEGTGLGLPIAKRLVESMNGKIIVESKLGKGSTFKIVLDDVEVSDEKFIRKIQTAHYDANNFNFEKEVLIVDDIAMNVAVLGALLKKLKVKYRSANSGKDALKLISESKPDVVLTDIWMPQMSGKELLDTIKSDPSTKDIPVVAVTADARFEDAGFDNKLLKPITLDSLAKLLISFKN